jgi:hypothetical protein
MMNKTKTAVAALAAFATDALTGPATMTLTQAGPGFHLALSHRRRLRVLQRGLAGLQRSVRPRLN